jgi:flagellar biosynthesis protein FlhF
VIAAIDEEPMIQVTKNKSFINKKKEKDSIKDFTMIPTNSPTQSEIMESLQEMKRMMKGLSSASHRDPLLPDYYYEIEEKLLGSELPVSIAEEVLEGVYNEWIPQKNLSKQQMIGTLKPLLLQYIREIDFDQNIFRKKYISLVGPTGVGKTTTLAKLAANAVLKHGKSVGFITTDTYRIAAIEQLKTYASILDAPIEVCYNAEDFQQAKIKLSHLDVIFIDTAGRNFLNEEFVQELQAVINFEEEMNTFLVLSLTSKLKDMKKITDQFWKIGIHQFLFTKKDETTSSAAMFSLIHHYQKGATFITNGQSVPEDMHPATKEIIVEELLEEMNG